MKIMKDQSVVLCFNVQKEFLPALQNGQSLLDQCTWLQDLAFRYDVPFVMFNHEKLGTPVEHLNVGPKCSASFQQHMFSAVQHPEFSSEWIGADSKDYLLCGAETHITLFQTALDLRSRGHRVFVIADATDTRNCLDHKLALDRLVLHKIEIVTREMVFFEWLNSSELSDYMDLSLNFLDRRYLRF